MLSLSAVVTHAQALVAARELKAQVASQVGGVLLDVSALTQFDSSALAVMLACRREAMAEGKSFAVQGSPLKLGQLASLYGVAELIPQAP